MIPFIETLEIFLKKMTEHEDINYEKFTFPQSGQLFDEFERILRDNKDFVLQNSDAMRSAIQSYSPRHVVTKYRLTRRINHFIFSHTASNLTCNCKLRKELGIDPERKYLQFIDVELDEIFGSIFYKCNECNQAWTLEYLYDASSRWV